MKYFLLLLVFSAVTAFASDNDLAPEIVEQMREKATAYSVEGAQKQLDRSPCIVFAKCSQLDELDLLELSNNTFTAAIFLVEEMQLQTDKPKEYYITKLEAMADIVDQIANYFDSKTSMQ